MEHDRFLSYSLIIHNDPILSHSTPYNQRSWTASLNETKLYMSVHQGDSRALPVCSSQYERHVTKVHSNVMLYSLRQQPGPRVKAEPSI